ncbi:MAG: hypothetical protein ACRDUV_02575 [Pseudonocardiaceae bacterium]
MTIGQILLAIITGLAVNECCDVSPWAARKLVRWSARRRYAPPARAELRAEELAAYIDARPGRLFKLITALGFAVAAVATRKIASAVAPPNPLWQPTTLTIPVHYQDREWSGWNGYPKDRVVHQAWCQLTDEVCNAAKEVSVGSRSWRRCIDELRRVTGDERWTLVARNLDLLGEINNSSPKIRRTVDLSDMGSGSCRIPCTVYYWSFPAKSTIKHYQAAVETARSEIRRLTIDFLLSTAFR